MEIINNYGSIIKIGTSMNVIPFPKKSELPLTDEEAKQKILDVRTQYALDISTNILDSIVSEMINYGIKLRTDGVYQKDLAFLSETLNSILLRYVGGKHDFHEIAEKIINLEDEDEEESDKPK